MSDEIRSCVADLPIFDVHEHHMPEGLGNPDIGLIELLQQSYAGWAYDRAFPSEQPSGGTLARGGESSRENVARFVEHCGTSAFVRNMIWSLSELYELGDAGITRDNWTDLDRRIRERHADPSWPTQVLDRANICRIITDPYCHPLMDAHQTFGDRYRSVLRINAFAFGWHPDSRDHNGNSAHDFIKPLGCEVRSFDDYLQMLAIAIDTMADRHQVGLKSALAYDRVVNFDDVDEKLARQAWGKSDPTPAEKKAFGDVVVDRLCKLAGERDLPVQMHLGLGQIRGSHPMNAAGLIERHPKTRFLLMHLAYPWSDALFGLAFSYANVWLDLTWSWLLSPTRFKRALHEAIEILPDETRLMIGGDNWHAEETFGTLTFARRLIGDVLAEKVDDGYFPAGQARRLARRICHENAAAFFKVPS